MRALVAIAPFVLAGCVASGPNADPNCHWDCFGEYVCVAGTIMQVVNAPVPCRQWTGACPLEPVIVACPLGCRDGARGGTWRADAAPGLCIDNLPRRAGDPCSTADAGCSPAELIGDDGGTRTPTLSCDPSTLHCVEVP